MQAFLCIVTMFLTKIGKVEEPYIEVSLRLFGVT
jgi:hypothetical protein